MRTYYPRRTPEATTNLETVMMKILRRNRCKRKQIAVNSLNPKLPYIEYKNFRILIDTGSSRSFMNPATYRAYFDDIPVQPEKFEVKTAHALSQHEGSI
ncbi:hypothetical protein EVAR_83123_1 [Eumeta japonica]|uniref:Uncharacterized protein n=1 Tax=Eumeta variegata TaxID=151549 RepID=A0A4C1YB86_EUMVA|nr:hypothetical protein EVAR_83123_1 [Eumeta japonica]